jgi:carbon-monoxide dehydrogenase large subunit
VRDSRVFGPRGSASLADIARAFYLAPADLPKDTYSHGLEVTEGYAPKRLTGVHTGSAHAALGLRWMRKAAASKSWTM